MTILLKETARTGNNQIQLIWLEIVAGILKKNQEVMLYGSVPKSGPIYSQYQHIC